MPFSLGDRVRVWGRQRKGVIGEVSGVSGDGVSIVYVLFYDDLQEECLDCTTNTYTVIKIKDNSHHGHSRLLDGPSGGSSCIQRLHVSTYSPGYGEDKLTDGRHDTYWMSDGSPGEPHWIRCEMLPGVVVRQISVVVGWRNSNCVPSLVEVLINPDVDGPAIAGGELVATVVFDQDCLSPEPRMSRLDLLPAALTAAQRCAAVWLIRVSGVHGVHKDCQVNGLLVTECRLSEGGGSATQRPPTTTVQDVTESFKQLQQDWSRSMTQQFQATFRNMETKVSKVERRVTGLQKQVETIKNKQLGDIEQCRQKVDALSNRLEGMDTKMRGEFEDVLTKVQSCHRTTEHNLELLENKLAEENVKQVATQNMNNDILESCRWNAGSFVKLEGQRSSRDAGALCDIVISDGERGDVEGIRAHSNVLCTRASKFLHFLDRISSTRSKSTQPPHLQLCVQDFFPIDAIADKSAVEYVINFCYNKSSACELDMSNVENVYTVSDMIGVDDLTRACSQLVLQNITAHNWVNIYNKAVHINSQLLRENVEMFVRDNVKQCLTCPDVIYLSLDSFQRLFSEQNLDGLDDVDEIVLYETVLRWVKAESSDGEIRARREERLPQLPKLMAAVKFVNIPKDFLLQQIETEPIILADKELTRKIQEFLPRGGRDKVKYEKEFQYT